MAVYSVSNTDRDDPLTIITESTRPDEISLPPVTIPVGQQTTSVPFVTQTDSIPEGWHSVRLDILPPAGYSQW